MQIYTITQVQHHEHRHISRQIPRHNIKIKFLNYVEIHKEELFESLGWTDPLEISAKSKDGKISSRNAGCFVTGLFKRKSSSNVRDVCDIVLKSSTAKI